MTTPAASAGSGYGMTCESCGNRLIAPELSECVSERHVRHHWRCGKCGSRSEMSAYLRAEAGATGGNADRQRDSAAIAA